MHEKQTDELLKILEQADDESALREYVDSSYKDPTYKDVASYLEHKLETEGLERSKVIEDSCLQRTYGYQILQGTRNPGRDKLISLCIAIGMDLEEVQRALAISNQGRLYPKRRRDAIIIFAIQKGLNSYDANALLYEFEEKTLIDDA